METGEIEQERIAPPQAPNRSPSTKGAGGKEFCEWSVISNSCNFVNKSMMKGARFIK